MTMTNACNGTSKTQKFIGTVGISHEFTELQKNKTFQKGDKMLSVSEVQTKNITPSVFTDKIFTLSAFYLF